MGQEVHGKNTLPKLRLDGPFALQTTRLIWFTVESSAVPIVFLMPATAG